MKTQKKGVTLMEFITALTIFGVVGTMVATLFALCQSYYAVGAAQADVQSGTQKALILMVKEIKETSVTGYQVNSSKNAIVFVSARNGSGIFQTNNATGNPSWQKWICYYLTSQTGSTYSRLIRKEGNPLGSTFPATTPPAIPANWDTTFQNANLSQKMLSADIQTLAIESNCGGTNTLYIRLLSTKTFRGQNTFYTSGISINSGSCNTGYWTPVIIQN